MSRKALIFGIVALFAFFGGSIKIRTNSGTPDLTELGRVISVEFNGSEGIMAATPNAAWDYVRGIATFVRTINNSINSMLTSINSSGLKNLSSYTGPAGNYKIEWKSDNSVSFTRGNDGALLGNATYTKSMRVFNSSNLMILEMYMATSGALLIRWMPSRTNSTSYTSTGLGECQITGSSPTRTMYCSFSGGPFASATPSWATALIKVQESSSDMAITALSKTSTAYDPDGGGSCSSGTYYFPMAFITKTASPNYTIAKFGFNITNKASTSQVCDLTANPYNYGLFNTATSPNATDSSQYFVQEGVASGSVPSDYPSATTLDTLAATITNTGAGDGKVDVNVLDNLSLTFKNSTNPF